MFRTTRPDALLAHVLAQRADAGAALDPARVEDVIVGCAMPEYEQGMNVARIGVLLAGLPDSVAGMTINRFCSSGLNAVSIAADRIRTGEADVMIAAGTESMSMIPMLGRLALNAAVFEHDENVGIAYGMGLTAEKVADAVEGVARGAGRVRARVASQGAGGAGGRRVRRRDRARITVDRSTCPTCRDAARSSYAYEGRRARRRPARRHHARKGSRSCRPVFAAKGSVTAGNSSQMSDGAGASILMSERVLRELDLTPLARFVGFAVAGVPPEIMGVGPIAAIPKVADDHGYRPGRDRLDRAQRGVRRAERSP